jgi:hypothetical protein
MKISDLPGRRTDEGLSDWLASTGLMGGANKAAAQSKQQQEQAYKIGLKDFTNKINGALKTAVDSGVVSIPQSPAAPQQAAPVDYDIPTAQRQAQAGAQTGQAGQTGDAGQTGQVGKPGQAPVSKTPKTPTSPTSPTTATAGQSADDSSGIQAAPGFRVELHDKSDRQMTYYKTDKGWFSAVGERVSKPSSIQYLDKEADSEGRGKYTVKEVPIPPAPAPMTKGGKSANAQAKRQAQLTKKNQQQKQDDDGMNESYRHLNWLLENRILREQDEETVSTFIQNFIAGQTSKFPQNPAYVKRAKALADQAESEYLKTQGVSAELSKQLWDLIWAWSQLGGSQSSGQRSQPDQSGDVQDIEFDKEELERLSQTGDFLKKLSDKPSILQNPASKGYLDQIIKLAKKFGGR